MFSDFNSILQTFLHFEILFIVTFGSIKFVFHSKISKVFSNRRLNRVQKLQVAQKNVVT